jgi:hypothetical protein
MFRRFEAIDRGSHADSKALVGCNLVTARLGVLNGNKVLYLGRKGESHVEEFPRAKD